MAATINNNNSCNKNFAAVLANAFAKAGDKKAVVAVKQRLKMISDDQVVDVRKRGYILVMFLEDDSIAAVRTDVLQQVLDLLENNGIGWTEVLTDSEAEAVRRNQAAAVRRNRCTPPVQHNTTVYVDRGFDPFPHIGWGMRDMADDIGWHLQDAADDIGFFLDSLFF